MLLRHVSNGAIAISQPRHAWLAGELARAWGAPGFLVPEPRDALLCAVALHDIGWVEWERAPRLDPTTGYPLTFADVEATTHTRLWTSGVEAAGSYGALPALHVSRHGVAIYELTFDATTARPEQAEAVSKFVKAQMAFQKRMVAILSGDPLVAPYVTDGHLDLARRFVVAVDTMSLHLCWGVDGTVTLDDVPTTGGATPIKLYAARITRLPCPWPFTEDTLVVRIEGKRLGRTKDQASMDRILRDGELIFESVTLTR